LLPFFIRGHWPILYPRLYLTSFHLIRFVNHSMPLWPFRPLIFFCFCIWFVCCFVLFFFLVLSNGPRCIRSEVSFMRAELSNGPSLSRITVQEYDKRWRWWQLYIFINTQDDTVSFFRFMALFVKVLEWCIIQSLEWHLAYTQVYYTLWYSVDTLHTGIFCRHTTHCGIL
jgi:hypothetical protein